VLAAKLPVPEARDMQLKCGVIESTLVLPKAATVSRRQVTVDFCLPFRSKKSPAEAGLSGAKLNGFKGVLARLHAAYASGSGRGERQLEPSHRAHAALSAG
jgi:hypothetical protein